MGNRHHSSPDYSRYTIEELEDVLDNIDKAQFPERYAQAKETYSKKVAEQAIESSNENDLVLPAQPNPKWSEQLLITRIVMGVFLIMLFSVFPTIFIEFMAAKSWTENTTGFIWVLAFTNVVVWVVCLVKDSKLTQRLKESWRGKLAILVIPVLFMMMSGTFIDKSLPLGLHIISAQQEVRNNMNYRKRSGRKHCRQRLEIIETEKLEDGDLCMTESQRNSLPEEGKITVVGTLSAFGMVIEGFHLP